MTAHKELKSIIRERQNKTGESYTAARAHVMRARAELLGLPDGSTTSDQKERVEAIVLKVNQQSVRVRITAENAQVTFRSSDASEVVPGHVVTLVVKKRWTWRGDAYASGEIENPRIDIAKLGLTPLPLKEFDLAYDLRSAYEPFRSPDPYAPLWRKLTAKPRACYDMDPIAWGAFPDAKERDIDENPTCDAAELAEAGDVEGARELLMDALLRDLRCIDAHAHLGNLEFDRSPERAMVHYEIGILIGELSLPPGFDGALLWGRIYNRPFLRCLYNYGLCLWRLGRAPEAQMVFERILSLNPNDNQGARFCWESLRKGGTWEELHEREQGARAQRHGGYLN
jgi:tetratricopeptide (TPR) repeat protein